MRHRLQLGVLIVLAMGAAACDLEPFGATERRVAGDYRLDRWEDGTTYYLVGPGPAKSGGGTIEGTVERIGWSDSVIVVRRKGMFGEDGWMIVDVAQGHVSGPLSDSAFQQIGAFQALETYPADSAWWRLE